MNTQVKVVAIEGVDGAGKNTLTTAVAAALTQAHCTVSRLAFPRYGTVHADLIAAALKGNMGDLVDSPYAMATLFALDRREAAVPHGPLGELLSAPTPGPHIVLLDRWVASNAAYSAARTHQAIDQPDGIVSWVAELEYGLFQVPIPHLTILLDVPVELARERAAGREAKDSSRTRDIYERDAPLQERTAAAYRNLAATNWQGPWMAVPAEVDPQLVARTILTVSP